MWKWVFRFCNLTLSSLAFSVCYDMADPTSSKHSLERDFSGFNTEPAQSNPDNPEVPEKRKSVCGLAGDFRVVQDAPTSFLWSTRYSLPVLAVGSDGSARFRLRLCRHPHRPPNVQDERGDRANIHALRYNSLVGVVVLNVTVE